ncbi:MAG: Uncharacterised protein [Bacteroidetes bacterium MED-G17]|nr:MAG: Uncharacterised protein [Bacteroidetes bacterium MED-G17]
MAPPPIQLPAKVLNPRQSARSPVVSTVCGKRMEKIPIAKGPPMIIPKVPVKNMTNGFQPNLTSPLKSILSVIRNNAAGNRNLVATKYKFDFLRVFVPSSPITCHSVEIKLKLVSIAGNK